MRTMILAAGRGERMRPLTDTCPKPLLVAGGKPLIGHHLERLAEAGLRDVVINHAHLGRMLEDALGDGSRFGVSIRYSAEEAALETAGGIRQAQELLGDDVFLVINGDVFCDFDIGAFANQARHLTSGDSLAHLMLVTNPPHHSAGDFTLKGGRVSEAPENRLTYAGIGLFHPDLFSGLVIGERAALGPLLRMAMARGRVSGERHDGYWIDVGTPERLAELDSHLKKSQNPGAQRESKADTRFHG